MNVSFDKAKFMQKVTQKVLGAIAISAIELQETIRGKLNLASSNIGSGGHPSTPGNPPAKRTGALARSIQAVNITKNPLMPTYRVGTNNVYARIQEYGGRIRAKKGKFLPIPVGVEGQRAAKAANGDIRKLNLRLVRTKGGKLLLVKDEAGTKKGKGARSQILFVLKKEVYLPPRPYIRPAYAQMKDKIEGNIKSAIEEAIATK